MTKKKKKKKKIDSWNFNKLKISLPKLQSLAKELHNNGFNFKLFL